jgi:hypothetical protein
MTDHCGSNMASMAEAHRKAHARDIQNDLAPGCSMCGLKAGDQLKGRIPISKLLLCSRCQGIQYCSKVSVLKILRIDIKEFMGRSLNVLLLTLYLSNAFIIGMPSKSLERT